MSIMTIAVLIAAALIAGYTDLRARRIPNWLTAAMVIYGLGFHVQRAGWTGVRWSVSGLALGLGLMLIPYLLRGLGAGDVKFLAAVGSIVGAQGVLIVFALATALGAMMGTMALNKNGERRKAKGENGRDKREKVVKGKSPFSLSPFLPFPAIRHAIPPSKVTIPYGIALSVGTLLFTGGLLVL